MLLYVVFLPGCAVDKNLSFSHDKELLPNNVPCNKKIKDRDLNKFSFAIISDLWGGYRPGVCDVAIEQINLLHSEFIMTVGDFIDGVTEDKDQLNKEWKEFNDLSSKANAPMFYVGGNHVGLYMRITKR
ncbi:MAG: hypothetical protein V3V00_01910 [Saprospiraceae bacterium]